VGSRSTQPSTDETSKVFIDGLEFGELNKYANKFFSYRCSSVYSPPEVLQKPKALKDPEEKTDVYSYGMILW
jgi:serine/threonine protein kinase